MLQNGGIMHNTVPFCIYTAYFNMILKSNKIFHFSYYKVFLSIINLQIHKNIGLIHKQLIIQVFDIINSYEII